MSQNKIDYWWRKTKEISAWLFAAATTFLSFMSLGDIGITTVCSKLVALFSIIVISGVVSLVYIGCKNSYLVWSKGIGRLTVMYGDLMNLGFEKPFWSFSKRKKCMVVIPVNTYFDTIVDENPVEVVHPIVSPNSLHGMWVKRLLGKNNETGASGLERAIFSYLDRQGTEYDCIERERGSRRSYPIGTCALIGGTNDVDFILLSLTRFDENNKAFCNKEWLIEATEKLLKFIDSHCQGYNCYVPLMGTNLARTGLSHKEVLQTIVSVMELYNENIHYSMNVVIYEGDKSKVSIFDSKNV